MKYKKGEIIRHLKTLEYLGITTDGKHVWLCECLLCGMKTVMKESTISFSDNCGCKPILAPNGNDLTGRRFGKLTVLGLDRVNKTGVTYWKCRCDCGNECIVSRQSLQKRKYLSCGCTSPKTKVHVGAKYGRLTVIEDLGSRNRIHYWRCQCDCGTIKEVRGDSLTSGNTRSCGCLQREAIQTTGYKNRRRK